MLSASLLFRSAITHSEHCVAFVQEHRPLPYSSLSLACCCAVVFSRVLLILLVEIGFSGSLLVFGCGAGTFGTYDSISSPSLKTMGSFLAPCVFAFVVLVA